MINYYAVLGVPPAATEIEVKKRYRDLVVQHHPDAGGDTQTFAAITEAGSVLCDSDFRRAYDQKLKVLCDPCPECKGQGVTRYAKSFTVTMTRRCGSCQGAGYHDRE